MTGLILALASAAALTAPEPVALEQLQRVYQQSCAERAYGSYNDMCDQMRRQIRAYLGSKRATPPAKAAPTAAIVAAPTTVLHGTTTQETAPPPR